MKKIVSLLLTMLLLFSLAPAAFAEGEQPYTETRTVDWVTMSAPAVGGTVTEAMRSLWATYVERVAFMAEGTDVRDNIELVYDMDDIEMTQKLVLAVFSMQTEAEELAHMRLSASDQRQLGYLYWQAFDADVTVTDTYTPTGEYAADGSAVYKKTTSERICLNAADYLTLAKRLGFTLSEREKMVTIAEETEFPPMNADPLKSRTTEARRLLRQMSDDGVDPLRRAAADSALSLLGKVDYFWGGKSEAIGWDMRWSMPRIVTSAGAHDSGRMGVFGLDCSGFVSWALRNGAAKRGVEVTVPEGTGRLWHACREITWDEAQPGDLVFADVGDSEPNHVGMLVGHDADGEWVVCQCYDDGIVLSSAAEFPYVCAPNMFSEEG